jgi:hypothetical protein
VISSTALYNAAKHKGLRGLAHPIYGTSFETFFGQTSENFYSTTFVNKAAHGLTEMVEGYEPTHRDTIVENGGCDMAAGSSPESWVGHYVSVELVAEPGSETNIGVLRGGGLESRLEGVSEYGVVLLMVRYDELEDRVPQVLSVDPGAIRGPLGSATGAFLSLGLPRMPRMRTSPFRLSRKFVLM